MVEVQKVRSHFRFLDSSSTRNNHFEMSHNHQHSHNCGHEHDDDHLRSGEVGITAMLNLHGESPSGGEASLDEPSTHSFSSLHF